MESDQQLVESVLRGDREAYAQLVERYQHAVFAAALRMLRDREAASDAAQNAFVTAYENLRRLRDRRAFGAWLLVIARREALSLSRDRPRMVPLEAAHDQAAATVADEDALDRQPREMMAALSSLPDHEQRVLMLRYFDSQPVGSIAEITGRSVGTVTKQITRALRRLRKLLGERGQ